jgi:REP element-mobilizing transposase RayT
MLKPKFKTPISLFPLGGAAGSESTTDLEEVFARAEPDLSLGSCALWRPDAAMLVQNALLFFEGQRYNLSAWCVMPNHVHVVVTPKGQLSLASILHSWKSFTANEINKVLGQHGPLWERESLDHLIRSIGDWERCVEYTEQNAVAASLCDVPEHWPYCSRGAGFRAAPEIQFTDPRKTPFALIRSRGELPHLYKEGGTYFVTFRLRDALPVREQK